MPGHDVLHSLSPYSSDPSLTLENVTKATATVNEYKLGDDVLSLPPSKQSERSKIIEYFVKYSPYASWSRLAGRLYYEEEHEALSAARKFIKGIVGKCVYVHSLVQCPTVLVLINCSLVVDIFAEYNYTLLNIDCLS